MSSFLEYILNDFFEIWYFQEDLAFAIGSSNST